MKLKNRLLLIIIFFLGIVIFNSNDCFAAYDTIESLPYTDEAITIVESYLDDYYDSYVFDAQKQSSGYRYIVSLYNSESTVAYCNSGSLVGDTYNICFACNLENSEEAKVSSFYLYIDNQGYFYSLASTTPEEVIYTGDYTTGYCILKPSPATQCTDRDPAYIYSNRTVYSASYDLDPNTVVPDLSFLSGTLFEVDEGNDKLNLFELNLKDLDFNNQVHQFNIATYTNDPYYDELMNYYNNDYQYFIYVTDYQRILTYGEQDNDDSYQYGSYALSGYIDFLIDDDAFAYYSPVTKEIRYSKNHLTLSIYSYNKQTYSDISDIVRRFYFELTYSEDSNDPNIVIWSDNGNLKEFTVNNIEPEYKYFIGGSTNIRYADCSTPIGINTLYHLTDNFYYVGYLGQDGKRDITDIPFYRYDFDFAGGTTKLFFLNSPTYATDILETYEELNNIYNDNELIQDTSEGGSYKQGQGYATSTFQPGDVTENTTPEDDEQYFGQIESVNNGSIDETKNWTVLDFLKNIYYALTGKGEDSSSAVDSVTGATDTVTNKFSFKDNMINNANEIRDFISNTQESHKYYLNINHKYLSGNICIIDLSWYEPYKPTVDSFICAFAYLAFIWHMFCIVPNLIRGASAGSYVSDTQADSKTGFGRSSNIHKGGF